MTVGTWLRPTELQAKQGIVAILRVPMSIRTEKGVIVPYTQDWRYTVLQMNRRIARGGSLPAWITPILSETHA